MSLKGEEEQPEEEPLELELEIEVMSDEKVEKEILEILGRSSKPLTLLEIISMLRAIGMPITYRRALRIVNEMVKQNKLKKIKQKDRRIVYAKITEQDKLPP